MSYTENESGTFLVFLLPAVVGCLTILLARRWSNSQVSSTSSTAVSRRRKIIKDPLVKRPLPPLACPKMVQPGSKKVGVAKKGSFPVIEEELNGGKRVKPRLSPSSNSGNSGPVAPKHIPFPHIPQDGDLLFEVMTLAFTLVASGLQFLNLYRTAWWLPHSHINQAMNFYLIDQHLVLFIFAWSVRRALLAASLSLARCALTGTLLPHAHQALKMFILGVVLGAMAWCAYFIYLKYPLVKVFYLCYPAVIYFVLFGLQVSPFLELNSGAAPLHCCTHDPQQMAAEVDALREDFNMRVKKILFNSIAGAYYSSFVPLCFAQPYLYYDVYSASQQVVFVWGTLCARYCCHLLSAAYCDVPHRAASHLRASGTEVRGESVTGGWASGALEWRVWNRSAPPATPQNAGSERLHSAQYARFYAVFINPSTMLCVFLCLQLTLIFIQLCLLFSSIAWHNFIAIVILLFINYYTLFKMLRDYLVSWKVYKAENLIHEKNYAVNYSQN